MANTYRYLINALNNIIEHIPAHIYWKDTDGRYLGCNNLQIHNLGFKTRQDVIGKNDFNLPWPDGFACEFRKNDLQVIETCKINISEENSIMFGKKVVVLSQKCL